MDEEQLTICKTTFGDTADDDWLVIWRGLPIGRILKQSGVAHGRPDWFWTVNFDQRPVSGSQRGVGAGLADCQRQFKIAWSKLRATLTKGDVAIFRRHFEDAERRARLRARQ